MQLDNTQIGIRERGFWDTLDLSLQIMRSYARPMCITFSIIAVPLCWLNDAMISWILESQNAEDMFSAGIHFAEMRFIAIMSLLVFIQAPFASLLSTLYLGQAIFLQQPSIRGVIAETVKLSPRWLFCQLLLRGVAPACLLVMAIPRTRETVSSYEVLLVILALFIAAIRSARPYVNEIIMLERNPLRSTKQNVITIDRRMKSLHVGSYGNLLARWLGSAVVAVALTLSLVGSFWFLSGMLLNSWQWGPLMLRGFLVGSMWIVAAYISVVRYLSYMDVRIRNEGWEVELQLRAEGARVARQLA